MDAHLNRVLFSGAFLKVAACAVFSAGLPLAVYAESGSASVTEVVQQTKTVTGLVVDSKGETIIGANIMEKGTSNGTITDFEGKFKLNVSPGGTLVVSYIGFKSVELLVNQLLNPEVGKTYTITLKEDTEVIDEVVVIGYGTQRKGDVTSAIASVKAEDFTIGKIGDAADLIKGKVAGLTIAKGTGDPNSTSTIRLRGVISVNGSTTPLVLVDGVEGDLGTVAPENIESIDVLKDASAAAIYGTRGANGVILITTKNGKRGERATASYSGYVSASQFGKKLEFMDAADVRAGLTNFTDKGYDTDWLDAISRTGFTHNHNFNITGGTEKTTYSADFTYRKEDGVIMNTYAEDIHMRFDVSHWMLNDMLRVNLNMVKKWHKNSASNVTASDGSNTSYSAYRQAIARNPTAPIYNEDGSYNEDFGVSYYYNPVGMLEERLGDDSYEETRASGNITFEPIKGWQTNLLLATARYNRHDEYYTTPNYYGNLLSEYNGYAAHTNDESRTDNLEITSKYDLNVGKHRMNALVGYSYQYYTYNRNYATNFDFPTTFFTYNNLGSGTALKEGRAGMGSDRNENTLIGFFGRVSYAYDNRYNILVSVRREGSSKFGENNKWGTFPSVSLGWTISNEKFMQGLTWLNNLKLRAGFGVTGVIPNDPYMSLTRYEYSVYYKDGDEWKQGLKAESNPNPDLKWEKSTEFNVGLDWSVLNDRLGGSIDVYTKKTTDLLFDYSVPTPPNLYNYTFANGGSVRNHGVEIAINAIPVRTKDFEWKTVVTLAHNQSKLLSLSNGLYESNSYLDVGGLGEPISVTTHRMQEGRPLGEFYGLKSVGVSENGLFLIEKSSTGEIEEFSTAMLTNDEYRQYLGNGLPKVTLGWTNNLSYKNWDLSMQFTSQLGFQILNEPRAFYENNSHAYNRLKSVLDAPYGGEYTLSSSQPQTMVSYYLENGNFLKLTNLTIGYTFPVKPNNKWIKGVRAYLSGDNLFCITGYSGLDPELANAYPTYAGIDYRDKYPSIRSFTFGVNLTF